MVDFSAPGCRSERPQFVPLLEHHMKYILLIHHDEQAWARLSDAERYLVTGFYFQRGPQ